MNCRSCGTEIASKAIICFRCGASTTDPVRKPYVAPKRSPLPLLLPGLLLMAVAVGMVLLDVPEGMPDTATGVLAGAGLFLAVISFIRRR
ncbi:MAG: hypothetical protein M3R55_13225 [Acidobacteriota bacterium]|nr:hypothetical protein [Acidobacteriota bacterium]